ncbi:MAG: serine/threonine-protein phosphatase [Inquilinus sp.]|nr:serine/threonine-protein phosphatase [Inquilinus sp.]
MMSPTPFTFVSASVSEVGFVRKLNEDACLDRPDLGLWAVADGMGGHDSGDYASRLIVDLLGEMHVPHSAGELLSEVRARLDRCNAILRDKAAERGEDSIIASTVVTLLVFGEHFACIWAGDSRLYRLRGPEFLQVSRDHSHVQEMVDMGVLSESEAGSHPQSNVVTRAVGADDEVVLDKMRDWLQANDVFLLCSDGLTGVVPDAAIAEILAQDDLDAAVQQLVDTALARGSRDNITAVAVRCLPATGWEKTVPF